MTGKITSIDTAMKTVTLQDRAVVNFDNDMHAGLDVFKVADAVKLHGFKAGNRNWGTSISAATGQSRKTDRGR